MNRDEALERLPTTYRRIMRMLDAGLDEADVAEVLGIDADTAIPLLCLARAKLESLVSDVDAPVAPQ